MTYATRIIAGVLLLVAGATSAAFIAWRVPDQPVSALQARWAPPPSQFIAVRGMQVHVRDEGPRDDVVPIVLLHGTGASLHTWDGWTPELTRERRVIRFDLPGFGLTGPSPDGVYSIESYVDTVLAVADTLGVPRFAIEGRAERVVMIGWEEGGSRDGRVVPVMRPIEAVDGLPVNVKR